MIRVAMMALMLVGCVRAEDRVRRVASPEDDPAFVTRCRHSETCLDDAKEICPGGYEKVSFEAGAKERELQFKCHGKANW